MTSSKIQDLHESNIDHDNPDRPGTAIIWHHSFPLQGVINYTIGRIQFASLGSPTLIDIYGPSGSGKQQDRSNFYGQKVFDLMHISPTNSVICGGDFNCILSPLDVEHGFGFQRKNLLVWLILSKPLN